MATWAAWIPELNDRNIPNHALPLDRRVVLGIKEQLGAA